MKRKEEGNTDNKKRPRDKSFNSDERKIKKDINNEIKESMGEMDTKTIAKYVN